MPYSAKIGSDTPQVEFRVFHNALLRLPQNSYSARWVSDQVFLGRVFMTPYASMGIPMCIPWQVFLWVFLCLVFQVRQVGSDAQVLKARGGTVTPPSFELHVLL